MKWTLIGMLACGSARAQCIMCRTAAAAQSGGASHAMDRAILILLGPAVVLFCGIFLGIFRSRASAADEQLRMQILKLYDGPNCEGWDLHAFFELAGDGQDRARVLEIVDSLVDLGYLESRGSDFYTLTEKGKEAADRGSVIA